MSSVVIVGRRTSVVVCVLLFARLHVWLIDCQLLDKLRKNPVNLLVKCARAYDEYATKYSQSSFWKCVASKSMKIWHDELLKEIDVISAFLESDAVVLGTDLVVFEQDLISACRDWLIEKGENFKEIT